MSIKSFKKKLFYKINAVKSALLSKEEDNAPIFHGDDHYVRATDLAAIVAQINNRMDEVGHNTEKNFIDVWGRFTEVWNRIDRTEKLLHVGSGLTHLHRRVDLPLMRLEVLMYYLHPEHKKELTQEQQKFIEQLWTNYSSEGSIFPPDPFYQIKEQSVSAPLEAKAKQVEVPEVLEEDGQCYVILNGHKLYLPHDKTWGQNYIRGVCYETESVDSPHCYLNPEDDGVDLPEGTILADIGGAEGIFGIKYLDRCKKIYFFETDPTWLKVLEKTCAPYKDKIEIVKGFVGDQPGNIHLDEFFAQRGEKPTFIKMDIEGAEGSALRSMPQLLADNSPLTMLICTYHRQEDWGHFYEMLKDKFSITPSRSYYWHIANMRPPFLRHGVMRAVKKV